MLKTYQLNGSILKYVKEIDKIGNFKEYLEKQTEYKFGQKTGIEIEYYRNNCIKRKLNYSMGDFHGIYQEYYENYLPKIEAEYWYGKKNGTYKEWYATGILKIDTFYHMGNLDNKYKEYSSNGSLIHNITYDKGNICFPDTDKKLNSSYNVIVNNLFNENKEKLTEKCLFRYNYLEKKFYYNQYKEIMRKLVYFPSSEKVKSEIIYFLNGSVKEKKNFNYIGKLDGIQILRFMDSQNNIFIKKKIRFRDGKLISVFNDDELIFNNDNNISVISQPNKDIIGWKACLSNDISTLGIPVMVRLRIPRKAKRLLFIYDNSDICKSRAEYAIVEEIHAYDDQSDKQYKEAVSFIRKKRGKSEKFKYKLNQTVYPDFFDPDINNTRSGGIHYCLHYDEAKKYHLKNEELYALHLNI